MNNSPNFLNSIKPEIRNLNVRTISKMIASKIITTTELQLQREPNFCKIQRWSHMFEQLKAYL